MELQKGRLGTIRDRWVMHLGMLVLLSVSGPALQAQITNTNDTDEDRMRLGTTPIKPFRIIGNIYYVGAVRVSSFLIKTADGYILMDTGYKETAPIVRDGLAALGVNPKDVKILLSSHAHQDHVGGHAQIKELTGARILASEGDTPAISTGGRPNGPTVVKVDGTIRDQQQVTLGDVTLTAHVTPGHTKGCTTWTMVAEEGGRKYNVVFMCSASINAGARLTGDAAWPTRGDDLAKSIALMKSLPCDVFLGPHGFFFNLVEKVQRMQRGETPNPFIDPAGYRAYLAQAERVYNETLARERVGQ